MDVVVTARKSGRVWQLADLLGRSMGYISQSARSGVRIVPSGHAVETMAGMKLGPFASLDAALAEIERHTRGVCRRSDHPDPPP